MYIRRLEGVAEGERRNASYINGTIGYWRKGIYLIGVSWGYDESKKRVRVSGIENKCDDAESL